MLRPGKLLLATLFVINTLIGASAQTTEPVIGFTSAIFQVTERSGVGQIDVVRSGDTSGISTVDYVTNDDGASNDCAVFNAKASSHCDFNLAVGTLKFAPGETAKTIGVVINRDSFIEAPFETFAVILSNPTGGATLGVNPTASVNLIDVNDGSVGATTNLIDRTNAFVRQQYHDFLNREPDVAGLNFWVDNIDKCDDPNRKPANMTAAECKEVMRINTSAAFFLSIEFSQSAGLVHAFYAAALDRPRRLPGRIEFERDHQLVARGVVVGQDGWEALLEANRNAFIRDFVMRPEFVALYPTTDTPALYAAKLYLHALGRVASAAEIDEAVREFEGGVTAVDPGARGRILLRLIASPDFSDEFNRAFVQMQYDGYLQRNPNELPDLDFSGFDFWLEKLNNFHGNFIDAEMVKSFLLSSEYRRRFGPA